MDKFKISNNLKVNVITKRKDQEIHFTLNWEIERVSFVQIQSKLD